MDEFVAEKKFAALSIGQKIVFVGKLILFICSFGFAFPLLLDDPNYDKVAKGGAKVSDAV